MSALWHHEQHRLALANVGFGDGHHDGVRMSKSAPCSPMKAQARPHDPLGGLLAGFETNGSGQREANDFHVVHKVPVGDSPYVRAKHVQLVDKDPEKAIALFWKAINANDRVDSALKDMAIVMKQQGRSEEAIEAIRSLRSKCSEAAQESLDNVLLDLYKRCGRLDDQIELLKHKLNLIHQGLAFNGKRTKTARSQGKKFQVSIEQEATRLLGNLGWAYMQQNNFLSAEAVYRKALSIEPDNNKMCNLGICLMKQDRIDEARAILNNVTPAGEGKWGSESHQKSFERAQEMLREIEATQASQPAPDAAARDRASYFQARAPTLLQLQQRKNAQPQGKELQTVADALRAILSESGFGCGSSSQPLDEDEELLSLLPPSRTVTPPVFTLPEDLTSPVEGERPVTAVEPQFAVPRHQMAPPQQPMYHPRPMSAPLQRQVNGPQFRRQNPPNPKLVLQGKQAPFSHAAPPYVPQKQTAAAPWGGERYTAEQLFLHPQKDGRYSQNFLHGPHPMAPPPQQKPLNRAAVHTSPLRPPAGGVNMLGRTAKPPQEQTAPRYAQNVTRPQGVNRPPQEKSPAAKALFAQPQSKHRYSPQEPIHMKPTAKPSQQEPVNTMSGVKPTAVERYAPPQARRETVLAQPERVASAPIQKKTDDIEEALSRTKSAPEQTEPLAMPQLVRSVLGPRFSREGSRDHLGSVPRVSSPSKINSPRRSFERLPSLQSCERSSSTVRSSLYHSNSLPTEAEKPWESDHENENPHPQDVPMSLQQGPSAAGVKRNRVLTPVKDNQNQENEKNAWQSLGFSSSPLSFPKEGGGRTKGMFMAVLEAAAAKQGGGGTRRDPPRRPRGAAHK